MAWINPFDRDREVHYRNLTTYKVLTLISWLLNFIATIYYLNYAPNDDKYAERTIFGQSNAHPTPFTINHVFVSIYWVTLWLFQIGYVSHLYSKTEDLKKAASAVGSHFILFNLFQFAWVFLWTRSHFFLSEAFLVLNFIQQASLYFRHPTTPRFIHVPVVSMPLVWSFFAVLWNGAVMVHCHDLPCRILANVSIWGILVMAAFFLIVYRDYTIGFSTAFLTAGLGVAQFASKIIALQWIFAFTIMALTFVGTLLIAIPEIFGISREQTTDRERAPLLQDN